MSFLLRLKSWQLFIVFSLPAFIASYQSYFGVIRYAGLIIALMWIYSIGISINELIPENTRKTVLYFKVATFFVTLYLTFNFTVYGKYIGVPDNFDAYNNWLGLCAAISWLYITSFSATRLESVIDGKTNNLNGSLKSFFCILFYPIGVWYVQPAIKNIYHFYDTKKPDL